MADNNFLQEVIEITGKNSYELMILNEYYKTVNFQIDEQNDEKEQKIEILKIEYFENKKREIDISHTKFIQENLQSKILKNDFEQLIMYLDLNIKPKNIERLLYLLNFNYIELDEDMKLISICSAAYNYYKDYYHYRRIEKCDDLMKTLLNKLYNIYSNGMIFKV